MDEVDRDRSSADRIRREVQVDDRPLKVAYIVGTQRSGTTILARVLGSLEGFVFAGELRRAWTLMERGTTCGCGLPYSRCGVWSSIVQRDGSFLGLRPREILALQRRVAPSNHSWWRTWKLLHGKTIGPEERRYLNLMTSLYGAFAANTSARVLIDSSKVPVDPALLLHASRPTVYCIHVVRDPRGVLYAGQHRAFPRKRAAGTDPGDVGPWRTLTFGVGWSSRNLAAEAIRRRYGEERSLVVRYEDFAREPLRVLSEICALVGQASDVQSVDPGSLTLPEVHNPSRTSRAAFREVAVREDDSWERDLRNVPETVAWALTAPIARRYGYVRRRDGS